MISKRKITRRAARKESLAAKQLLTLLRKQKQPLWHRVAAYLARPRKKAIVVNLDKLNKLTKAEDVVVVPGKVLGKGKLDHKLTLAAAQFSASAAKKLKGMDILSIPDLVERLKEAKGVTVKIII